MKTCSLKTGSNVLSFEFKSGEWQVVQPMNATFLACKRFSKTVFETSPCNKLDYKCAGHSFFVYYCTSCQ